MKSLPQDDADILDALRRVAEHVGPPVPWQGTATELTSMMFGGFVKFANDHWFPKTASFSFLPHATTVGDFIAELRRGGVRGVAIA